MDNPFCGEGVARCYVRGRRYYHDTALDLGFAPLRCSRVGTAIDLGCGTGLSTRALRSRANRVIALDISMAMLRQAPEYPATCYVVSGAERLPVRHATVDLATVGAAFHWFDQSRAFADLARVLRVGGGLIVYSDFFLGWFAAMPEFAEWFSSSYLPRFPTPPRHAHFDQAAAAAAGFVEAVNAQREVLIPFTRQQFVEFLLSQSNVAAMIQTGMTTVDDLRVQLTRELAPFFPGDDTADVAFGIKTWTTKRASPAR